MINQEIEDVHVGTVVHPTILFFPQNIDTKRRKSTRHEHDDDKKKTERPMKINNVVK